MGRYIEWDDVISRYPEINTLGGADEIGPAYIEYAEGYVDSVLRSHFTPPFSNNNLTVRDLSIDCVYWRAGRFKLDSAVEVKSAFFETVSMLKTGSMVMVTTSQDLIDPDVVGAIYSSTQSYHTAFGMDDPIYWEIDEDQIDDTQDDRL